MSDAAMPSRRGARALTAVEAAPVELDEAALAERREALGEMGRVQAAYGEDRDLLNQMMGQVQMASSFARFADVVSLTKLRHIKETKLYRALAGQKGRTPDGREIADVGTFDGFCQAIGLSRAKVDEDLSNLAAFGEEALKQLSAAGCGYRELRQFRRLPDDSKEALIEAAKSGDKEGLLDLAEELIARQAKEKAALAEEITEARADLVAKDERAAKRERDIEALQKEVRALKDQRRRAAPDEAAEALRSRANLAALQVRADISAQGEEDDSLHARFAALREQAINADADGAGDAHDAFMAAVIGELLGELRRLRDAFGLPIVADHGAPDWQRGA